MLTVKLSELQSDPEELLRNTQEGRLSLVTRDGEAVFVTVPVDERLFGSGLLEVIAVKLFQEKVLSLGKAAELARQPIERFFRSACRRRDSGGELRPGRAGQRARELGLALIWP